MLAKLALRNLLRNRWRTGLTVGGIAVATAVLTWNIAIIDGTKTAFIRGFTDAEPGQVQIHSEAYVDRPSVYEFFSESEALLDSVRNVDGVTGASGRCHVYGLVGHEQRSQIARVVGISPESEPSVTLLAEAVVDGRWLSAGSPEPSAPREVLLGETFSDQLAVDVGDELVVFVQAADGSLGNDLLVVVGIVRTGNSAIDRQTAYMRLSDVQYLAALDGRLHEVAIGVADVSDAPRVAQAVADRLADVPPLAAAGEEGTSLVVRPWQDSMAELSAMLEIYDSSIGIMFAIILGIVALGLLNTQRMSARERRRELGVLKAIGLKPRQLGRMVVLESVVVSLAGALLGAALGLALSAYHATAGLDMSLFSDEASFSMMGVAFSERLYAELSATAVVLPIVWTGVTAMLCGLWPAWTSARLDTTQAIGGRTD